MNNPIRSILPPNSSLVPRRLLALSLMPCCLPILSLSCTQPGYRNEVYPGQQGTYVIKQVPIAPTDAPAAAPATPGAAPTASTGSPTNDAPANTPAPVASSAATPQSSDADPESSLTTVQSLWPKLSPANRAAIVDLTRHLASQ